MFVSCVLEYVKDLDGALREIVRMAGNPDNVFIVTVQPWTLTARLYPGARWRGTVDAAKSVTMQPVGLDEKLAVTGTLALALAAAFWPQGGRR